MSVLDGTSNFWDGRMNVRHPETSGTPAPLAVDESVVVSAETTSRFSVLDNDSDRDGNPLHLVAATADHGTVEIKEDQTLSYAPPAGFVGNDTINYVISNIDDQRSSAVAYVRVVPTLALTGNTYAARIEGATTPIDLIGSAGIVTGGDRPVVTKTGGDDRLAVADNQILIDDSEGGFSATIDLSVTDALDQGPLAVKVAVTVHERLTILTDQDTATLTGVGDYQVEVVIPAGEPYEGTYNLDPLAVRGQAPALVGGGARPFLHAGTLFSGIYCNDPESGGQMALSIAWYDANDVLIAGETGPAQPATAAYARVTATDANGSSPAYSTVNPAATLDVTVRPAEIALVKAPNTFPSLLTIANSAGLNSEML